MARKRRQQLAAVMAGTLALVWRTALPAVPDGYYTGVHQTSGVMTWNGYDNLTPDHDRPYTSCRFGHQSTGTMTINVANGAPSVKLASTTSLTFESGYPIEACALILADTTKALQEAGGLAGFSPTVTNLAATGFDLQNGLGKIGSCQYVGAGSISCNFNIDDVKLIDNNYLRRIEVVFDGAGTGATKQQERSRQFSLSVSPASGQFRVAGIGEIQLGSIAVTNDAIGACGPADDIVVSSTLDPPSLLSPWGPDLPLNETYRVCPGQTKTFPIEFKPSDKARHSATTKFTFEDGSSKDLTIYGIVSDVWKTKISLPFGLTDVDMYKFYDFNVEVTNTTPDTRVFNFSVDFASDLNASWPLNRRDTIACDGFLFGRPASVEVSGGATRTFQCTAIHSWDWAERTEIGDYIASLTVDGLLAGAVETAVDAELAREAVATLSDTAGLALTAINEMLTWIFDYQYTQEITYTVQGGDGAQASHNIDVPAYKRALMVNAAAGALAGSSLSTTAIASGCLNPASAAVLPCSAALVAAAAVFKAIQYQRDAAIDPRSDYDILSQPRHISVQSLDRLQMSPEREWALKSIEYAAYSEALFLAYARYLGAVLEGATGHAARQWSAAQNYHSRLIALQKAIAQEGGPIMASIANGSVPDPPAARAAFASHSMPPIWRDTLNAVGVTIEEQASLERALSKAWESGYTGEDLPVFLNAMANAADSLAGNFPIILDGAIGADMFVNVSSIDRGVPPSTIRIDLELTDPAALGRVQYADLEVNGRAITRLTSAKLGDANGNGTDDLSAEIRYEDIKVALQAGDNEFDLKGTLDDGTVFAATVIVAVSGSAPSGTGTGAKTNGGGGAISVSFLLFLLSSLPLLRRYRRQPPRRDSGVYN